MALPPPTSLEFVELVKSHPLAFVKWGAQWCVPCKRIQPHFDTLAQTNASQAVFLCVEADSLEFEELALAYRVNSLPTFQVFVNQKLVDHLVGAQESSLTELVHKYVGPK